jgi:hypothetical protein
MKLKIMNRCCHPLGNLSIVNIRGKGHAVRYKPNLAANQWLGGKTWKLAQGGTLSPE